MRLSYRDRRYRSADGRLTLFARDYPGDGAPLLLMHGLSRNSADFEPLAAHLAGSYRLIVADQRGRGRSDHDPEPANYRPDIYAADMWALLDSLEIERAGLIGTSMGGLMAMIMGATRADRVPAIVLNDVGPEIMTEGLDRIRSYVGGGSVLRDWDEAADRCAAINGQAFPDFGRADWLAFARRTCTERPEGGIVFAYDPAISSSVQGAEPATVPPDLWPLWDMLSDIPILLIRGGLSDLLSGDTAAEMGRRHRGPFTRIDIPNRGHAPLLDEPPAVAAIREFLDRHV
jgi:pimeloyl-ACP methyl ester carboxylesterase